MRRVLVATRPVVKATQRSSPWQAAARAHHCSCGSTHRSIAISKTVFPLASQAVEMSSSARAMPKDLIEAERAGFVAPAALTIKIEGKKANPTDCNLFVYHGGCPDGFGAALAAFKALGDKAKYLPAVHGPACPVDLDVKGKHVVVADYCFPAAVTKRMIDEAASFIILDHHASAQKDLVDVADENKVFEMKMSGCTLAWSYFHPDKPIPLFFRLLEDKDIWRWGYPGSKEFTAGFFGSIPKGPMPDFAPPLQELKEWNDVLEGGAEALQKLADKGSAILDYQNKQIKKHIESAVPGRFKKEPFNKFRGLVVNGSVLASEIGNVMALTEGYDFGLIWRYDHEERSYVISLRSARDDVDVSAICKSFGGGGHPRAAGFTYLGAHVNDLLTFEDEAGKEEGGSGSAGGAGSLPAR
jgi:uncharacterized protein